MSQILSVTTCFLVCGYFIAFLILIKLSIYASFGTFLIIGDIRIPFWWILIWALHLHSFFIFLIRYGDGDLKIADSFFAWTICTSKLLLLPFFTFLFNSIFGLELDKLALVTWGDILSWVPFFPNTSY